MSQTKPWVYRDFRHPYHLVLLLLFVVYPYWWAIKRHKKIRKLRLSDELAEQRAGSPLDMLLQVADDSINEGLRNSSTMFGIFLLTLVSWEFQHAR